MYAFNLLSFSNLRMGSDTQLRNPYTKLVIGDSTYQAARAAIRLGRVLGYTVKTTIEQPSHKGQELIVSLFQEINTLGNHTDYRWLSNAPPRRLRAFCVNLHVIWKHRTGMSRDVQKRVCPPRGEPLSQQLVSSLPVHLSNADREKMLVSVGRECLHFITAAQDIEDRRLAANLFLCALTTVSRAAAVALPWLYESVTGQEPRSS